MIRRDKRMNDETNEYGYVYEYVYVVEFFTYSYSYTCPLIRLIR